MKISNKLTMMVISIVLGTSCVNAGDKSASPEGTSAKALARPALTEEAQEDVAELKLIASAKAGASAEAVSLALYDVTKSAPIFADQFLAAVLSVRQSWSAQDVRLMMRALALAVPELLQARAAYHDKISKEENSYESEVGAESKELVDSGDVSNNMLFHLFNVLQSSPSVGADSYANEVMPPTHASTAKQIDTVFFVKAASHDQIVPPLPPPLPPPPVSAGN